MKTLVALSASVFAFAGMCHAAQIASPAIYAGLSQKVGQCLVYNAGSANQTVRVQIFDEAGTVLADSGNCIATSGGQFCALATGISNGNAYACTARAGNVANLHGIISKTDWTGAAAREGRNRGSLGIQSVCPCIW
jgi:hypothetical protein